MSNINPKILILGIGNLLLSDEGLGVHVIHLLRERFEFPPNVILYDGGTGGLSLLSQIKDKDYLFIIDAILMGEEPGTIAQFSYDSIPDTYQRKDTAHGIDILDVLAAALTTDNLPNTVILGIQPSDISTPSLELTPSIASAVEPLVEMILARLAEIEVTTKKKKAAGTKKLGSYRNSFPL